MSVTTIILATIVIVLVYVLYVYFIDQGSDLATTASLMSGNNQPITTISSGQSTRYSYGIWVYVNTWNTTSKKVIFSRAGNLQLYLAPDRPTLYCDITCMKPNGHGTQTQTIMITDNFAIQKWVYITISSDNMILDCYLDGKLVNSNKLANSPATPGTAANDPVMLGSGWDCYISGLKNTTSPVGPQQVWDDYMSGTGNAVSNFFSSYSLNFSMDKNNVQQSSYSVSL
jgi:hypothetical protein